MKTFNLVIVNAVSPVDSDSYTVRASCRDEAVERLASWAENTDQWSEIHFNICDAAGRVLLRN